MQKIEAPSTTSAKALQINLDQKIYGAFAEIGAGQEVARFFFLAGKASQTVAKTMSAYDMIYSDEIYGKEEHGRYVCESRLLKMISKEYSLLERRLKTVRGDRTQFFAYANTVATGDITKRTPHGWMGIRFQTDPMGAPSDLYLHVRMLDLYRLLQQEALGVLGVNLIHAAFFARQNEKQILAALVEGLKRGQVAIDLIVATGTAFEKIDGDQLHLEMLRMGLTDCVLVNCDAENSLLQDVVYGKDLLVASEESTIPGNYEADLILQTTKVDASAEVECPVTPPGETRQIYPLIHRFENLLALKSYLRKCGANDLIFFVSAKEFQDMLSGNALVSCGTLFDGQTSVVLENANQIIGEIQTAKPEISSALQTFREKNFIRDSNERR